MQAMLVIDVLMLVLCEVGTDVNETFSYHRGIFGLNAHLILLHINWRNVLGFKYFLNLNMQGFAEAVHRTYSYSFVREFAP
jgi:hypothetical protein